jgi:hypothetical protein
MMLTNPVSSFFSWLKGTKTNEIIIATNSKHLPTPKSLKEEQASSLNVIRNWRTDSQFATGVLLIEPACFYNEDGEECHLVTYEDNIGRVVCVYPQTLESINASKVETNVEIRWKNKEENK